MCVLVLMEVCHECLPHAIPTHPCTRQALLQHVGEVELGRFRSRRRAIESELLVTIPVVWHVIQSGDGTDGHVTDAQVNRQIDVLNAGYVQQPHVQR